jgi:glycosyltransferase involved in cell wall biosynthesis
MQNPLVTVITPVYNGEPYLRECIESVLAQTYSNWEYIIVNNCSTDRSLEIAQQYNSDSRICVYNNGRFLPQLKNLNFSIGLASPMSAYYKMVLADDWIFPECLERMVRVAEENPTVGIVGSYRLCGHKVTCDGLPYPSTVVSGREVCRLQLLNGLFFFGSSNSILMRGEVVRSRTPFYDEAMLHADTDACYAILHHWDFGFVHQVLTFTRVGNESFSSAVRHLNPHPLDKFIALVTHGPTFLERSEFDTAVRRFRREYFRMIARGLFYPDGWAQYKYHKAGLKTIGYKLSVIILLPRIFYVLTDMALNLKSTVKDIWAGLRLLRRLLVDSTR